MGNFHIAFISYGNLISNAHWTPRGVINLAKLEKAGLIYGRHGFAHNCRDPISPPKREGNEKLEQRPEIIAESI